MGYYNFSLQTHIFTFEDLRISNQKVEISPDRESNVQNVVLFDNLQFPIEVTSGSLNSKATVYIRPTVSMLLPRRLWFPSVPRAPLPFMSFSFMRREEK